MINYKTASWIRVGASAIAVFALAAASAAPAPATAVDATLARELRSGWRFAKGDYTGAEASAFDDHDWVEVRVPHDWAIAGPFNPAEDGYAGKLPWRGVGWYRRQFTLECKPGTRVYFDFDGVMAFPKIYINGKLAGEWDYGYTPFRVDATSLVNLNGANVIAVRVDTTKHGTRWYPGAGIYRKVTLQIRKPIHIAHWSTFVTTPEIRDDAATLNLRTAIANHTEKDADVALTFRVRDPEGKPVASISDRISIPTGSTKSIEKLAQVPRPQRWDIATPRLYTLETSVAPLPASTETGDADSNADALDSETTQFGIRTFEFTPDDGFHLNGKRVQIYGVNLHHDHGPLGAAFYTRAMQRQLEIMRDMGVNAIRTSHNVPAAEVLDLCDRMGFIVWEECFDKWNETADRVAGEPSHEQHAERHLRAMVLRDRNHPSVVTWSIGNEIPADREGLAPERVSMMRSVVRKYDPTRPIGLGCDNPYLVKLGTFAALDLTGWNYARRYAKIREKYPEKPIVYSESASALSTRGFYELPLPASKTGFSKQWQVSSYDFNAAQWSDIPDAEFKLMQDDRFVAGEFVWTGFDYIGEPTPFTREAVSSYFGIVDTCGIPKDRFYLYRSCWRPDTPTVHILPHWNWPDRVGKTVPVFVYTNGDSAELFLNGKSLGRRTKGQSTHRPSDESPYYDSTYGYRLRWNEVPYEPGHLKAVAYKDGNEIGTAVMRTADKPARLRLTPDRTRLIASGDDLCYVLVEAVDALGSVCPLADNNIHFEVTGTAEIAGVGNGNPLSLEPFQSDQRRLFYGKAMAILRTIEGRVGEFRITASSDQLPSATSIGSTQ